MSNKDLFKEAIADAKAVREAALANAKAALEEALAPKLQSMLAAKLQEMDNEDLDEAKDKEEVEEGFYPDVTGDLGQDAERAKGFALEEGDEEELEEDFDLSSILAELSKSEEELDEAKKKEDKEEMDEAKKEDLDEAEEAEKEEEEEEEEESEEDESESDDKITDLTVDELKDIIKDIISAEMGGGEAPEMDDMSADMGDMGGEEEMAVDIDGEMEGETEEIAEEDYDSMDEIDLEELLAELDSLDEADEDDIYEAKKKDDKKKKEDKEDMKEAIDTIEALRNELHEVNLLNAKLLYVNKVFKAKNLTESQKLKVIAQFDKAETPAEAKAIFESMNAAIEKSKKSIVKESLGFASKAAGVAPKKPIVEVDATVSRWQMLAGINKF
jgi:hypothetical protein